MNEPPLITSRCKGEEPSGRIAAIDGIGINCDSRTARGYIDGGKSFSSEGSPTDSKASPRAGGETTVAGLFPVNGAAMQS